MKTVVILILIVTILGKNIVHYINHREEGVSVANIECNIGDVVELVASAQPSTGFSWIVPQFQLGMLEHVNFKEDKLGEPPVRAGGSQTFTYKLSCDTVGTQNIDFIYGREWEVWNKDEQKKNLECQGPIVKLDRWDNYYGTEGVFKVDHEPKSKKFGER